MYFRQEFARRFQFRMTQPLNYPLEKKVWTDADFDKMGWHDSPIYKISLTDDLELDIDYILKWNLPELEGLPFTFWVAPATLVFKNIRSLSFEFDVVTEGCFEIDDIDRDNNEWTIITQRGNIQFTAEGFEQFIRQEPSFQFTQTISYIERNGYSLDRITDQDNPYRRREDILEQRKQNFEHYENAKKRHLRRQEMKALAEARENNQIDTKSYLLKKKEIGDLLFSYDFFLKGTLFENY